MIENQSVKEIQKSINSRDISIKEVVEYYLDKIEKFNPDLNAIVLQKDRELIIKEAIQKDNANEIDKPLNGLPIAIKDLSDAVGFKTTYGFPGSKNNQPKKNSLFVNRLIDKGAIIIGKTNTAELGVGGHTINRLFGPTSNVYDPSKSAAGSSGGASSAVAAGLLPFADGTDQMGSCRGPAAYANIYGFRPTPGLIPVDHTGKKNNLPILTTPGCFAKNPNDMSILLDEIVGSDLLDRFSFDLDGLFKNQNISDKEFSAFSIGWLSNMNGEYNIEKEILEICENKLRELEKMNIKVDDIKPKINNDFLWRSWTTLRAKSIYEDTLAMNISDIDSMTYQAIWEYKKGQEINSEDLQLAIDQKQKCLNQIDLIFGNFDFLALPSAQIFPFDKNLQFPTSINNIELDTYHRWLEVFILSSLLDLPTFTIPVGFNRNGLPMGMQIIARNKDDLKLFSFVSKYEIAFNYSKIKPKFN
ncbi:amidase family protein [Candidatus Pelagibacter sp.]|nr:amidase family protein [Candidatus Pelagibacter sp.]